MEPTTRTVLFFGDQTDAWVDGIDQLFRQAIATPWLQSFLDDVLQIVRRESNGVDHVLRDSLGDYSSLLELAERYRHTPEEVGMVRAILLHTVRAGMLLQWVRRDPQLVSTTEPRPESLGISGGLLNLCALAISADFDSLYDAVLEVARIFIRLCILTSVRSRAMENNPGTWGWAVLGITSDELGKALEQFQQSMGIPLIKRAKIGVTGDRWSTVIGPPTVLELVIKRCPALLDLPKHKLSIHALQHVVAVSTADIDYIVGSSTMLNIQVIPKFRVWGMDNPKATYTNWRDLLKAVVLQVLSLPLDIVKVVRQLNLSLGSRDLDVKIIGPSSHTTYLANAFKNARCTATFHNDKSLEHAHLSYASRVAIVGMAGRGPGSDNLEEFWKIIMAKEDLCREIPKDRFDIEEFYCKEHKNTCTTTTRLGCFMKTPGNFDSRFFHISPREALLMDPGHRQFLMSTYEALESAGYSDGQTRATNPKKIAAFYGQSNDDWHMVGHYTLGCDAYTLPGNQRAFGAGRVAFHFKWEGPTYSLDSACASSTSATHLACMSLLTKDIDMAVVGAANILSYPHSWTSLSKSGVLSDTGNCKTYRDDADGYCRADFVGTVVLKRLEDALTQNDNILAVVAGSGRNQSGNSTSITTSDAGAQETLFRKVLLSARVSPHDVSYVEMHGTGTRIGDPAEMTAVMSVFKNRQNENSLTVGGIKANIGHSEAAAGMASLLKCVMMFQKNTVPPQAGMPHTLNPNYPSLSALKIEILSDSKEFQSMEDKPRRILMNNFDAAGGNACLLLEDFPAIAKKGVDPRSSHVIVTSAKTQASYSANKRNLLKWLRANETVDIQDMAYTTTARRLHHPIRFACTASTTQELISKLESDQLDVSMSRVSPIVFVFTGQGSHYAGMGHELYVTCQLFHDTINLCSSICQELGFPHFVDIFTRTDIDMSTKDATQIQLAVVALEIGLATFWKSCGIQPAIVIGHSLGEYSALHSSGVLSLADTLYLVGHRARLFSERCEIGACAMLAVAAPASTIEELLERNPQSSCAIACKNSPNATVISGSTDDVAELQSLLTVRSTKLSVPYGFHSLQMDPVIDDYVSLAGGVTFSAPKIPVASTLLGAVVDTVGTFDAVYLGHQTRQVVDFVGALDVIQGKLKTPLWLEIGPNSVCSAFVRDTISTSSDKVVSSLETSIRPWASISKCLVSAYRNGVAIDWFALHAPFSSNLKLLNLPSYAWDLRDFWITYTEASRTGQVVPPAVPPTFRISTCAQFIVRESKTPNLTVTLRASIESADFKPLIDGHRIRGVSVVPGSVFCESALAAAKYCLQYGQRQSVPASGMTIRNVSLKRPLTRGLVGSEGELLTTATAENSASEEITVSWKGSSLNSSYDLGTCIVTMVDINVLQISWERISYFARARMEELRKTVTDGLGHRLLPGILYALFSSTVDYDPAFKCIQEAFISDNFEEAVGEIILNNDPHGTHFVASPYWGESLVHLAGFLINGNPNRLHSRTTFMMDSFDSFEQAVDLEPGRRYFTYVRVTENKKSSASCDAYVFDTEKLVVQCSALRFHEISNDTLDRILGNSSSKLQVQERTAQVSINSVEDSPNFVLQSTAIPMVNSVIPSDTQNNASEPIKIAISTEDVKVSSNNDVFKIILESIAKGTGTSISDLTDDTELTDLGVDSIMGIEIAASINSSTGLDILPSFLIEFPTIGDLRNAFARPSMPSSGPISDFSMIESAPETTTGSSTSFFDNKEAVADTTPPIATPTLQTKEDMTIIPSLVESDTPFPATRVVLLQGRSSSGQLPFFLIADGAGSIATYIHLRPFKSNIPIYGIDSPYLRCPSRLTTDVGIPGVARFIVEAMIKFQPAGSISLGGFSGGAMISYEVCRQLVALGRSVENLLLIDMCCPRSISSDSRAEIGWKVYESIASQDAFWNASDNTQLHLRSIFASVAAYHPPPMTPEERPKRTVIIWARKGLIDRCSNNLPLMQLLASSDIPTEPFDGFMEDPRMGAVAWGLPHKTPADLGHNGWRKYIGESLCLAVDADHLEMPMVGHVHLLQGAMEEAFAYLRGGRQLSELRD